MIDIRELRIGSSVLFNDERVKVRSIADINPFEPGVLVKSSKQKSLWKTTPESLSPIPITEELLKELGFEEEKPQGEGWDYGIEKVFMKEFDSPIEEDYFISLAQYEGGLYQLQVLGTIAYVRDLHTLQNFVYLTTKKELI